MSYNIALVKILDAKYLDDFLSGELYLNTFGYFVSLDRSDTARADPHDGATEARQVVEVAIQGDDGEWIPISGILNPVIFRNGDEVDLNVLCMFMMTDRPGDVFDARNLAFGDTAVIISDLPEFVRRVCRAAQKAGWPIQNAPIEYVDRKVHDGYMGPFRKFEEFAHQNEFRFVFKTAMREPCHLSVGCLRDITYVTASAKVSSIWAAMQGADA